MTKADILLVKDVKNILKNGSMDINPRPRYADGTPAHTIFVTHNIRTYNLSDGEFPITTLRPVAWKNAIKEILWIYQDQTNDLSVLEDKYGIKWWRDWESKDIPNTIGNRYGHTVKEYDIFNKRVLKDIKEDPFGRYHVCNLWQETELESSDGLKPCAYETIWSVRNVYDKVLGRYEMVLDMFLNQRSGDMLVASGAGNVNEVQYAALLMMVAQSLGYRAGKFTHMVVNEQIYDRHTEQAEEIVKRLEIARQNEYNVPYLELNPDKKDFYEFTIDDFEIKHYVPIKPQLKFDLGI